MIRRDFTGIVIGIVALCSTVVSCQNDKASFTGPDIVKFSVNSYNLGVIDAEEWFDIPITVAHTTDYDRRVGVEIVDRLSNAIEGYHYSIESNTVNIGAGKNSASIRIKGMPENIEMSDSLGVTLRLITDDTAMWSNRYTPEAEIHLLKCCPIDINAFTGYCKITSTWIMQYMGGDARLVRTERDPKQENTIVVKDMFYEGYDVHIRLDTGTRFNPPVEMQEHVVGSTGEAFGTIYGNGKLMMIQPTEYVSYYSPCEKFMLQYVTMYVENVGTVGTYANIFEWITDDEAERIMREGF